VDTSDEWISFRKRIRNRWILLDDLFGGDPQVQREVGSVKALAFDIIATCSGFVLGLVTTTCFIKGMV